MTIIENRPAGNVLGDKRIIYPGSDHFGWRDITAEVTVRGVGASDPTWSQIGSGPFYAFKFAVGDECWFSFHIPHDIAPHCRIHFHTHWLAGGTDVNPVKWQFDYTYARGFNQEAFDPTGSTITAEEPGAGVAYQHMVTESEAVYIPTLTEPDGIIKARVARVANGATDNTDDIFMLTSDIHYQSTDECTFDKAPNFYGAQT